MPPDNRLREARHVWNHLIHCGKEIIVLDVADDESHQPSTPLSEWLASTKSDSTKPPILPSFISDDMDLAVQSAIKGLSGYARLPFYQRVLKLSGYEDIVNSIEGGANPAEALTPELVSDLALVGPVEKCKETLSKYVEAGADMPIITPNPVGKQSPLEVMEKIIEVID